MSDKADKEFYSTRELAELLGLSDRTIYRYIESGDLVGIKIGTKWRIARKDLDNFLEKKKSNQ